MCACYHSRNLTQRAIEFIRIQISLLSHLNADSLAIPFSDQAGADRQRAPLSIHACILSWLAALDQHAIELSKHPGRNAAIGMFADTLSVEQTQQADWDVGGLVPSSRSQQACSSAFEGASRTVMPFCRRSSVMGCMSGLPGE